MLGRLSSSSVKACSYFFSAIFSPLILKTRWSAREFLFSGVTIAGVALIFHDCGELTPDLVGKLTTLRPAMLSLGASRLLWEDAALVPRDIVLYGNLPSKQFYSDATMPVARVRELAGELLQRMRATGHPFILGSECDVLNVPGSEVRIREKVKAFLEV